MSPDDAPLRLPFATGAAMSPSPLIVAGIVFSILALKVFFDRRRRGPLPPGPPGLPIIGNVFDVPLLHQWHAFAEWGPKYGDINSVVLLGQPLVILNSFKHATELLDKRSAIYSDRPQLAFGGGIVGWDQILVLLRYGAQFREYRRLMSRVLGSRKTVAQYLPAIEAESRKLLGALLHDASDIPSCIRKATGTIVLKISYGYTPQKEADPLLKMVDDATEQAAEVVRPGAYMVDVFPFLRYVPSWFPGAGWKRRGEEYRRNMDAMSNIPHQFVKQQMAAGTAVPSFTSTQLALSHTPEQEYRIKMSAASIYAGGADTTVSAEESLFLVMACYPNVQKKVQAELDAVVGIDRLPTADDLDNLPYLHALYLELLRWNQVVPLGVPHAVSEDDHYEGYFIPKGSIVLVNSWKILHDPETYPDPMRFNPDRFLHTPSHEPELDPRKVAFGFGRRICPGINLAEPSVLIMAAMILSVFEISDAQYADTHRPIDPYTCLYTGGTISHPPPFTCKVAPRSQKALSLILAAQG